MSVVKLSEGYARLLAREAFFWAWPKESDLQGSYAERTFKLPNPVYFLP